MFNSECLFCKIAAKAVPAEVVYEDERSVAFLDIHPRALGHVMVIAKHHCPVLTDLPDSEVEPLFKAVKRVADAAMRGLGADGLTICMCTSSLGSLATAGDRSIRSSIIPAMNRLSMWHRNTAQLKNTKSLSSNIIPMIESRKKEGETPASLMFRFSKRVKQSGVLTEVRKRRFHKRSANKRKRRLSAIYRAGKKKETVRLKKLGLA